MCDDEVYSPPIVRPLIIGRVGRKGTLERMHTEPTDGNGASQFTQARAETWGGYSSNNLQPRDRPRWLTEGSYADEPNTIPHPIPQTPPEPGIYEIRNCLTQQNLDSVYKTFAEGELVAERRPNPRSVSQRVSTNFDCWRKPRLTRWVITQWEIMPAGMGWTIQNAFNNSYLTLKSPELLYGDQVVQSEFPVSWDLRRAPGGGPEGAQFRSVTRSPPRSDSRTEHVQYLLANECLGVGCDRYGGRKTFSGHDRERLSGG